MHIYSNSSRKKRRSWMVLVGRCTCAISERTSRVAKEMNALAGGTHMTAPRLYGWNAWVLRGFVRDSLKALFPDMQDQISEIADPGEYGLESYTCRLMCVVIFIISIMPEGRLCRDMLRLLAFTPNKEEPWLEHVGDGKEDDDAETCMDRVKVKAAGMSIFWKTLNFTCVFIPKLILLYMTANAGVTFLMETAGMDDIIVNSVAMGFLLSLDELIVDALLASSTDSLTCQCEAYDYESGTEAMLLGADDTVENFYEEQRTDSAPGLCKLLCETILNRMLKLFCILLLTVFFVGKYYWEHCEYKGGQFVSKPVSAPKGLAFSFLNMFHFAPEPEEDVPYWTMPQASD